MVPRQEVVIEPRIYPFFCTSDTTTIGKDYP
ncbi:Uncharacterised protein [Serratia rubidaea]|uniref:Uncharacterized protein n=1 Tax=Serratia rubidaea TaxID=61652 RepID=A0A3S4YMK2_SERRU|nr:Uncharacterised protein [Serratia rubidaea]